MSAPPSIGTTPWGPRRKPGGRRLVRRATRGRFWPRRHAATTHRNCCSCSACTPPSPADRPIGAPRTALLAILGLVLGFILTAAIDRLLDGPGIQVIAGLPEKSS